MIHTSNRQTIKKLNKQIKQITNQTDNTSIRHTTNKITNQNDKHANRLQNTQQQDGTATS